MNKSLFALPILAIALLAGCGGGGGGSSPVPGGGSTGGGATATPSPSPTPTAGGVAPNSYSGTVVSSDANNAPVSGATVHAGTAFTYGSNGYVLSGVTASATTNASGAFTISTTGATYIEVDATGLVSAHRPIASTTNFAGYSATGFTPTVYALPTVNSDETSGLAEMNTNRNTYGEGAGKLALSFDADMTMAARAVVANEVANLYFAHSQPGTNYGWSGAYICNHGGFCANPIYTQENLNVNASSLAQADDSYVAEGPTGGHEHNVVSTTAIFVGMGALYNEPPYTTGIGSTTNYSAEEYATTTDNPVP